MPALQLTLSAIVALLLVAAAIVDWRKREIPEWVNIGIAIAAVPMWWATGLTLWPGLAVQLGVAIAAFAVFTGVWMLGQMGGGDVKLITVLALFFAPIDFVGMLVVMAIAGGVLTLVMVVDYRLRPRETPFENPYGIAIAFAGLWILAERYLNQ